MEKERAHKILELLSARFPDAGCELRYRTDFELLVAVILSAQCTDKRVNRVTADLFKKASAPEDFLAMGREELEKLIYSCGFYRQKAKSILSAAADVKEKHNGRVPSDFGALVKMRGVGRKTANVVMSVAFGGDNIAVDTHVFRVSRLLGLSKGKTPEAVEKDLAALLAHGGYARAHHLLIFHGRYCCKSQRPLCGECAVRPYCVYITN